MKYSRRVLAGMARQKGESKNHALTFLNPTVSYIIYIEVERDGILAQIARKRTLSALIGLNIYIYILIYIYTYRHKNIHIYTFYNIHILQMICMSGAFRGTTAATTA